MTDEIMYDPDEEMTIISADGIEKGVLRGNTIHITRPNRCREEGHDWQDLPSEPPSSTCTRCGARRD